MAWFKKRVSFSQFIYDLIHANCVILETHFDRLIVLADELHVLTEEDKEHFLRKAHALVMANLMRGSYQYFSAHVSDEEVGASVTILYARYLNEHKGLSKAEAERRMEEVGELLGLVESAAQAYEERKEYNEAIGNTSVPPITDPLRLAQFLLCQSFADFCTGTDARENALSGKNFAAFKLAKGLLAGDLVGLALKEHKVTF